MKIREFVSKKIRKEKIAMLTAYDFPFASLLDTCGIDGILVGDSLANVVLGLRSTREVDIEIMLHHARAVRRAVQNALLIGDMPFSSYQLSSGKAVGDARRFIEEAGCDAVKLEWFEGCLAVAEGIIKSGIPVMGHVGLTPQTADQKGGFKVQGKDVSGALRILEEARALEGIGCFSLVLECIPDRVAEMITKAVNIPTIGCGGGPFCDGQVLVLHDMLGFSRGKRPKFAKCYEDLSAHIVAAVQAYINEVRSGQYPDQEHSYAIREEEMRRLLDR